MKRALLVLLLVNLMLSACAPASAPTPIPSVTPAPTATPVPASTATPTSTPTSLPTNTPTPTSIPTPTTTPTLIPTFTLSGVVFFDYNGNGIRDEGEPPIPSAKVQVGSLTATAGPDGSYTLKRVPQGRQQVRLSAPGFRYTSLSVEAFQPVERPVAVTVEKDTRCDWGLMQGFLTLPFRGNYKIDRMYDHQPGKEILWWNGPHQCEADDNICYAVPPGTNEHPGIDYRMPEGTPVYAAAPGLIRFIDECNGVTIVHDVNVAGRPLFTIYAHLSQVVVRRGQRVSRGELIGYSGRKCTPYDHLHFDLRSAPNDPKYWAFIDPYKPTVDVPEGFWLSGEPLPIWTQEYHPANNLGFWTELNLPHSP